MSFCGVTHEGILNWKKQNGIKVVVFRIFCLRSYKISHELLELFIGTFFLMLKTRAYVVVVHKRTNVWSKLDFLSLG